MSVGTILKYCRGPNAENYLESLFCKTLYIDNSMVVTKREEGMKGT